MLAEVDNFLRSAERVEEPDELFDLFAQRIRRLGFPSFAYVNFYTDPKNGRSFTLKHTYPDEWVARYVEKDYVHDDPVIIESSRGLVPFPWDVAKGMPGLSRRQRLIFDEASDFGLRGGMCIPIHGFGGECALLSMGSSMSDREFSAAWFEYRHVLHIMAIYLHSALCRAHHKFARETMPAALSDRERECVGWMAKGKTNWEVSEILSLSEKTVNWHLDNVKRKLGVFTKTQAVVKAIMLGLVKP